MLDLYEMLSKALFLFIVLSFIILVSFISSGWEGIPIPLNQISSFETVGNSKQRFVANRDHTEIDLIRKLPRIKDGIQKNSIKGNFLTNVQSVETDLVNFQTKPELRHIAFLKVHKAASTTIQNILFRFGYLRNLSFVLPIQGHYFSKSSWRHVPLIPPKQDGSHYDMLSLHATFNYAVYSVILPKDTVYIASVREPFAQFVSAVNYYTSVYHIKYLKRIPGNQIENLIRYPSIYEKSSLSKTMNSMAKDFGFTEKHYHEVNSSDSANSTITYLDKLGSIFEFVLITENLEESLLILKRRLGWSLKDVLFISKNVKRPDVQISVEVMELFRRRNKLDFIIYDYFFRRFKQEKKMYGDDLIPELENFKKVLVRVNNWCAEKNDEELIIEATMWNVQFSLTKIDCLLILKKELPFIKLLREETLTP